MTQEYTVTGSGLKYKVLNAPGENAVGVEKGQLATVHYTGWLVAPDER